MKRRCGELGLYWRRYHSDLNQVISFGQEELSRNWQIQGYCGLHLLASSSVKQNHLWGECFSLGAHEKKSQNF